MVNTGTQISGNCSFCQYITYSFEEINGIKFDTKGFTYKSVGVIYAIKCECNKFYKGETKKSFNRKNKKAC